MIRQNGPDDGGGPGVGVGPSSSGSSGSGEQPPRPRRMPEERQKSFPKAYTESTHRHEWLEKMENAQDAPSDVNIRVEEDDQDDFIVVTTTVQPMEQDDPESEETGGKTGFKCCMYTQLPANWTNSAHVIYGKNYPSQFYSSFFW